MSPREQNTLGKDNIHHMRDTRIILAKDMAIKAFFYGERIVQALVIDFNRLMMLDMHGRKRAL